MAFHFLVACAVTLEYDFECSDTEIVTYPGQEFTSDSLVDQGLLNSKRTS